MKNQIMLSWCHWRFAISTQIKRLAKPSLKNVPKILGVSFVIGILLIPSFLSITSFKSAQASTYYDSGWIYLNNSVFRADKRIDDCNSYLGHPFALIWEGGGGRDAWLNLNTPAGNYKIDMKIGYSYHPDKSIQTNEIMKVYSGKNFNSNIPPTTYKDKGNIPDMGDDIVTSYTNC